MHSDYLFLWASDGLNVGTMQQASSMIALGLSWRQVFPALVVGNFIISAGVTLNGRSILPSAWSCVRLLTLVSPSDARRYRRRTVSPLSAFDLASRYSAYADGVPARYHIPFSVSARSAFGFYGAYFAVVSRLMLALIYFGINSQIGGQCMAIMLGAIWPSFLKVKNAL